ncbi:helix-turn-helix transcriptional regulator [Vibrio sp. Isolate31]|uniref:helix-turn-helix transcriptional regulator n=1 Tax=unclassified Vibrio TaxID=2614977 RepID=UPI001EFE5189|nr:MULTISPECIES: helix-turn-helix transcriptional regulator [unclassified Vibrio]MCG9552918.1 helix-turn-helix transcriptional regulator [Vibrio sp. Isolate32]MCG9600221.1 helix-turn-helix transcriptional regulator [Vibrio sp. Isolate31]
MPEICTHIFNNAELLNQHFDPDAIDAPIVPIYASFSNQTTSSLRSKMHRHHKGQLVYAKSGTGEIQLEGYSHVLLPNQMVWIPGGVMHQVILNHDVNFRAIYLDHTRFPQLSSQFDTFFVSQLLAEVIETICSSSFHTDWMAGTEFHLQSILIKEMHRSATTPQWPAFPKDKRLRDNLLKYYEQGHMLPRLNELAVHFGASERTLYRMFVQDTGMSYQKWRQRIRLILAIDMLATNKSITEIAHHLEFSTTSAFITFFKSYQNITPNKYRTLSDPKATS